MPYRSWSASKGLSRRTALYGIGVTAAARRLGSLGRASAQEATPADHEAKLADLLRATEGDRLRALVEANMAVAKRLHADEFQLITPDGAALSKADYLGAIASGDLDYQVFAPASEIAVRLAENLAVIRYQSRIEIVAFGEKHVDRGWHTDVYELHDGHWQAVWSQMTRIVD